MSVIKERGSANEKREGERSGRKGARKVEVKCMYVYWSVYVRFYMRVFCIQHGRRLLCFGVVVVGAVCTQIFFHFL